MEHGLDACVAGFKEVAGEVQPMPSAAHGFAAGEALGTPVEDNKRVVHRLPSGSAVLPALVLAQKLDPSLARIDARSGASTQSKG